MKKEEAFKAMKNGAIISHITWQDRVFIRKVGDNIFDDENREVDDDFTNPCYSSSWYVVGVNFSTLQSYQAEQLLKSTPLHLQDPNRVWCNSGHEMEEVIAKEIRELHRAIMVYNEYIDTLKDQVESLKSDIIAKDETIRILRERMNHF